MDEKAKATWEARLEEAVRRLEERLEALSKEIETGGERFGQRIAKAAASETGPCRKGGEHRLWGGMLLIFFGIVWMGHALHWWTFDFPWAAAGLIALGIYLVLRSRRAENDRETG